MWDIVRWCLNAYPVKFYRQRSNDNFIVDFYCSKAGLVIEVDGSQHFTEEGLVYDSIRTEILQRYDLDVLWFTNRDVRKNFDGVCRAIHQKVNERLIQRGHAAE